MTAASVLWGKIFWSWVLWASIAGMLLSGLWLLFLWITRLEKEMVTPPEKPKGSTAIYFGPGVTNSITDGNTIIGFDNAIVDHGQQNQHKRNLIVGKPPRTGW